MTDKVKRSTPLLETDEQELDLIIGIAFLLALAFFSVVLVVMAFLLGFLLAGGIL